MQVGAEVGACYAILLRSQSRRLQCPSPLEAELREAVPLLTAAHVEAVLGRCRSGAHPGLALSFFRWVRRQPEFVPSVLSYNLLLATLGEAKRLKDLTQIAFEICSCGLPFSPATYGTLIKSFGSAGKPLLAVTLFAKMRESLETCRPHLKTYNSLLSVLVHSSSSSSPSDLSSALSVYREMGCPRNGFTLNLVMLGLCKAGQWDESVALLEQMKLCCDADPTTFNTILAGMCRARKYDWTARIWSAMESSGCGPDTVSFNTLISCFCKAGRIDKAFSVVDGMTRLGFPPNTRTLGAILDAACKSGGQLTQAIAFFNSIFVLKNKFHLWDATTCNSILHAFCKEGRIEEAFRICGRMMEFGCDPNEVSYTILVSGLCKAGRALEAYEFFRLFSDFSNPNLSNLEHLANQFFPAKTRSESTPILIHVLNRWSCEWNIETYNTLISALCKAGEISKALQLFNTAIAKKCPPNAITYTILWKWMPESERFEDVYGVVSKMHESGIKTDTLLYTVMIDSLCKCRKIGKAFALLDRMMREGFTPDTVLYSSLINGLCKTGRMQQAFAMLSHMEKVGCTPTVVTYGPLIQGLCEKRRLKEASKLMREMTEKGCIPNDIIHMMLARAFYENPALL